VLDKLASTDFTPYLNQTFRIQLEGVEPVDLELISVTDAGSASGAEARHPFSLHFLGPPGSQYLLQHIYSLEHADMGTLELFLVPLGPDQGRMRYEAIFNWQKEQIMAEPFLSEIRIMSFVFAPKGWALCDGQLLPINQNQALFSLLGTTFGGNGQTNFALPDLRARTPIHVGSGHTLGERGGEQAHTLSIAEIPEHIHIAQAVTPAGNVIIPANNIWATTPAKIYDDATNLAALAPESVSTIGGSQAHLNMQPFLVLNFCIALQGIFPSPN
jgi:microcystin-dependent protein